jgi:oxaloacetate decarboxylase (Na+ extruding) subunit alpha
VPAVGLIDTTIRDGNQSLWASRMTNSMLEPVLPLLDQAGFRSVEMMSAVDVKIMVSRLGENPWDRVRLVKRHVRRTPLRMIGINQAFLMSGILPDDARALVTQTFARAGIDEFWVTAAMNDVRTAQTGVEAARAAGARVDGGIQFTVSPVHSDEFFAETARQFVELGVDGIIIKDAGGLLTPERARTLVPAVIAAAGGREVYVHSHCTSGLGPATNLEALTSGAAAIWTASTPLANGPSLPADESMAAYLEWLGYDTGVNRPVLRQIAGHYEEVARRFGKPVGVPAEYDPRLYEHQMPGGMVNHFRLQLQELGLQDRLPAVLDEMPRVREDFGWPNVQTPFAQFIGTQALLNVVHDRYTVIPEEVRSFLLGYYGRTPAPVSQELLDRVAQGREVVDARPGALVPPMVADARAELGAGASDEDVVLAMLFMPETLNAFRSGQPAPPRDSLSEVVRRLAQIDGLDKIRVRDACA